MDKPPISTISSRIAWECPYYGVRRDDIRLPDGSTGVYHVVEAPSFAMVVPVTREGGIVLIHNYRHTLGQWVWEVPAGSIKAGQTPEEAAREELREEVGGQTTDLHYLMKASTMNGIGHNYAHFFLALDVNLSEPKHEPAEVMTVHIKPANEVLTMLHTGQMNDVSSMTALFLAFPYLKHL